MSDILKIACTHGNTATKYRVSSKKKNEQPKFSYMTFKYKFSGDDSYVL